MRATTTHRDVERIRRATSAGKAEVSRVGPGRHLHGDGDDVVDDQGDGGDLGHLDPEVLPGHDIRAAGAGVDHDDLSVGEGDEEQHDDDGQCDGQKQAEGRHADGPHEHEEDLLGPIGGRRDAVRGEHPERHRLAEALDREALGDERRTEQCLLQRGRRRDSGRMTTSSGSRGGGPRPSVAQDAITQGSLGRHHRPDNVFWGVTARQVGRSVRHDQRAYFVLSGQPEMASRSCRGRESPISSNGKGP